MAEQQKPVIVDEEEQNVERTGLAIPLSTEEDDSKTVGEMIEAGEVALPKGEGTVPWPGLNLIHAAGLA